MVFYPPSWVPDIEIGKTIERTLFAHVTLNDHGQDRPMRYQSQILCAMRSTAVIPSAKADHLSLVASRVFLTR